MQSKSRKIAVSKESMKYSESHEWISAVGSGGISQVGVTDYAQRELGDIVYVELPTVGKNVSASKEVAVLESTKAAADVYSPVSGTIVEVNTRLSESPELINNSAEKDGWIFKIKLSDFSELENLMEKDAYEKVIKPTKR